MIEHNSVLIKGFGVSYNDTKFLCHKCYIQEIAISLIMVEYVRKLCSSVPKDV